VIIGAALGSALALVVIGTTGSFWVAVVFIVVWGFVAAAAGPVRQTYLNGLIPSTQRATILSFDSLSGSLGGVVFQPALGRAADLYGYGVSLVIGGAIQLLSIPFLLASRHRNDPADTETPRRQEG
jgi:sugar phosphate permease